jgi:hypothetical protein
MDADAERLRGAKRRALFGATVATLAMATAMAVPLEPTIRYAVGLVGVWLFVAAVVRYASARRHLLMPMFRRSIPIRFSGYLGRFTLRVRGDGRRVEVHAGTEIVAEAIATDERDELVVDLETVDDAELDDLGAAIGAAIEMVALADELRDSQQHGVPSDITGDVPWHPTSGGVLRTIGPRPS